MKQELSLSLSQSLLKHIHICSQDQKQHSSLMGVDNGHFVETDAELRLLQILTPE